MRGLRAQQPSGPHDSAFRPRARRDLASLPMSELSSRRARVAAEPEAAEARWLEASEQPERKAAQRYSSCDILSVLHAAGYGMNAGNDMLDDPAC